MSTDMPYGYPQPPRPPQVVPHGYPGGGGPILEGVAITALDPWIGMVPWKRTLVAIALAIGTRGRGGTWVAADSPPPLLHVDGHGRPPLQWGRTVVPVRAGRHQLTVFVPYMRNPSGPADTVVDVYPGRVTELEYRAPVFKSMRLAGALGPAPQPVNGWRLFLALYVGLPALFVLPILLFSLGGLVWILLTTP